MTKLDFIKQYLPLAQKAAERFGMNPVIILAQSAIETGWGKSALCREHNNFFGITAYGRPNPFWEGDRTDLSATTAVRVCGFAVTSLRKPVFSISPV